MTEQPNVIQTALQTELQSLLSVIAEYKKNIREAKTAAKKRYYQQKLNKLRPEALSILAAMDQLEASDGSYGGNE